MPDEGRCTSREGFSWFRSTRHQPKPERSSSGNKKEDEKIVITRLRPPWLGATGIQDQLTRLKHEKLEESSSHLTVHRARDIGGGLWRWDAGIQCRQRSMESVAMNAPDKERLVNDVEWFFSGETMQWYQSKSIPWRRGYLFHGPPGTGKTCLANAIASTYRLNIYKIDLMAPSCTDDSLETLFETLPLRCVSG